MSADSITAADPSTPPPPTEAHFDPAQKAWVLSRHQDVWAALREPHLWAVSGKREIQPDTRDEGGRLLQRAAMLESLSATFLEAWRPRLEAETYTALRSLPTGQPVDLLADFALPWGLTLGMMVTRTDPSGAGRLADFGRRVFAATGEGADAGLRADAAAATAELERILESGPIPMGEPAFVALSQTLPRLLASAWLALVRSPSEFARLRSDPHLLPGAIDELLRYRGNCSPRLPAGYRKRRSGRRENRGRGPGRADAGLRESRPGTISRPGSPGCGAGRHQSPGAGDGPEFLRWRRSYPYGRFGSHRSTHNHLFGRTI